MKQIVLHYLDDGPLILWFHIICGREKVVFNGSLNFFKYLQGGHFLKHYHILYIFLVENDVNAIQH